MLLPNNKQITRLHETANAARYAYNWTVAKQMKTFTDTGKYLSESEVRKQFTEHKHENAWLYGISNNATKQAIKDACDAFWRFIEKKKKPNYKTYSKKKIRRAAEKGYKLERYDMMHHPKFKKKGKAQPKFYADNVKIGFTDTHVVLEKIATSKRRNRTVLNKIRLAEKGYIPTNVRYTNPRVTFDGLNWWISVGIEIPSLEAKPASDGDGPGIDVGINKLAVESNGNEHRNINKDKKVRKLKKRQRRLQRSISRKYNKTNNKNKRGESCKKTCNIVKSERKLLKLHLRLTGIRHNHVHQVTNGIVKQKPSFIVVEDLNVQGMMKNKHLSGAIQEQCLYELIRQLEYKSRYHGITFKRASRMYPSSKLCSMCGNIKKDLKLSERTYRCDDCGNVLDRDLNAAINLMRCAA